MTTLDLPILASRPPWTLSRRNQWILAFTLLVGLAAFSRFGLIAWPFWNDSGLYIALGRSVAGGEVMYRDFYETKLPGAGMLMSAAWRAFGRCWPAYVAAQFAMTLVAAGSIARAVHRHVAPAAAGPCFLYAVAYLNFDYAVFTGFQLETIQAMFECLAAASALEAIKSADGGSTVVAGLAAGVAAMAKPGGAGVAAALVVCLLARRCWKAVAAVGCGFAIPVAATVLFAAGTGAWPYLPGVIGDIRRYTAGTALRWDDAVKVPALVIGLGVPFAPCLGGTLFGRRPLRGVRPGSPVGGFTATGRAPGPLQFAALWFFLDLAAAVAQHRMYLYYFLPLAGPAAVLFGMAARGASPLKITIGLLPVAIFSFTWEACDPAHWSRGIETSRVSAYIAAHTTPGDRVYVDPPGRVTIETDRDPGASAGLLFYWANDDTAPQRYCDRLIADLESRRTKYVILSAGWDVPVPPMADGDLLTREPVRREMFIRNWARFRVYLHTKYDPESEIDGSIVFRRKTPDRTPGP